MSWRLAGAFALGVAVLLAAACGKKGNPLPPLRPVPARIAELSAHRVEDRIELQFTVPAANADGTVPLVITRVEVLRAPVYAGVPPPSPGEILSNSRFVRTEIPVRRPAEGAPLAEPRPDLPPLAGERTTFVDRIDPATAAKATAWSYVVVASAGRGRRGVASPLVTVPLTSPPAAPEGITVTESETTLTIAWKPGAAGQSFNVFAVGRTVDPGTARLLTPKPIPTPPFSTPIEFGSERCFAIRTLLVSGSATVDGAWSDVTCVTAVDKYPPPAPENLAATQEGGVVTLTWDGVQSADLAGYVVLRGDASGIDMRPIATDPVRETTFKDATVQPGATYTYSVYAADNAATPNVSQQSNRQVVTVR